MLEVAVLSKKKREEICKMADPYFDMQIFVRYGDNQ